LEKMKLKKSDLWLKNLINRIFIDFPLVQILVVVASIQMRNLKTEVEKGFMRR